jgi:hypothetical protein
VVALQNHHQLAGSRAMRMMRLHPAEAGPSARGC